MALAGTLTAMFRIDTRQAQTDVQKLQNSLGKGMEQSLRGMTAQAGMAGNVLASLGTAGLAAGAAIGGLAAAAGLGISHVSKLGDQITTLSATTGLSTDFLQKLNHAANTLDVPFESAAKAVSKLQVNLGKATTTKETADALDQLGLSVENLRALSPEQQFEKVAGALQKMKNETEQAATAQALFGRGGIELLPLVRGNYEELMKQAEELGIVLDQDLLEAGDELGEQWKLLKTIGVSLLAEVIAPLVKGMSDLASWAVEASKGFREMNAASETQAQMHQRINELIKSREAATEAEARAIVMAEMEARRLEELKAAVSDFVAKRDAATTSTEAGTVAVQKSALERVKEALATKKQSEHLAELARFTGMSTKELTEQGAEFQAVAESMRAAAFASSLVVEEYDVQIRTADELNKQLAKLTASNRADPVALVPPEATGRAAELLQQVEDARKRTEAWKTAQEEYNVEIQKAADLVQILPGPIGDFVGQTVAAAAALKSLTKLGDGLGGGGFLSGIGTAFKQGSGSGGFLGLIGGASSVASFVAPMVSVGVSVGKALVSGIKKIFGGGGPDLMRDAARDLGATLTKGMEEQIKKSGRPLQLAVADIFTGGGFSSVDRFVEETADILSGLSRGDFQKPEAIAALEQALPLILQNLEELGPRGEEQLQRLIGGIQSMGLEVAGLNELMAGTFAPETVESMAEAFGLTNDQIREMADRLGIDVQTELERVAASVGLTAEEFKALGSAMHEQLGIPAEQLKEFLEATGLSAQELAEQLGVNVGEGAATASQEAGAAADETARAADEAARFADELQRAGRAAGGISFPGGPSIPGFAEGGFVPARPGGTIVRVAEAGQGEFIVPADKMGGAGGGSVSVSIDARGSFFPQEPNAFAEKLAPAIEKVFEQNLRALDDRFGSRGD